MTALGNLVALAVELLRWLILRERKSLMRLDLEEMERTDDRYEKLEADIVFARLAGDHDRADRLLRRQTRLVAYRAGWAGAELPRLAKGRVLDGPAGCDNGIGTGDPGQGRTDPDSATHPGKDHQGEGAEP